MKIESMHKDRTRQARRSSRQKGIETRRNRDKKEFGKEGIWTRRNMDKKNRGLEEIMGKKEYKTRRNNGQKRNTEQEAQ